MTTDFEGLIRALGEHGVEFLLAGGVAAVAHGAARATYDLDVVYSRETHNLERLVTALAPFHPYLRGAPPGLPFTLDLLTLERGLNFTLTTTLGDLDLLGEIVGGGTYQDLLAESIEIRVSGLACRCLSLTQLLRAKRAAGRPKDLEVIAELEALGEERG